MQQHAQPHFLAPPPGAGLGEVLASWLFTTDHKRLGLLYLALIMLMFAAVAALLTDQHE